MANEFVGKKLNVESRKGTNVETIIKQLSTKGLVRTEEGGEYVIADIRKKGRGLFITAAGGAKPKAAAATATAAPAQRVAAAVTFDEIEGKKIDGKAVVKVLRSKGTVKLDDGSVVELASISRKGRGYVTGAESAAPAPKAAGGARAKTASTETKGESVSNSDIRGQSVKVRIDGVLHTVTRTIKGEKFETDKGYKGETAEIQKIGSKYVLETADYKKAQAKAAAPAPKADAKPSRAPRPITRAELKGKNVTVGDATYTVVRTFKDDTVETDKGFRFSVADVARKGRGYIYTGELAEKKGGAVPRQRPAPEPVSTIVEIGAFDADTVADVRDLLESAVRKALADAYDVDLSGTFVQFEDQIANITFQIHVADAPAALVKAKAADYRAAMSEQAAAAPAPKGNTKAKLGGEDFDPSELSNEDDEDDEDDAPAASLVADADDEDDEDDDAQFSEDDEDAQFSEDDDVPNEDDADDADFPDEAPVDTSFPEDATTLIENGVGRLSKLFPGKTMNGFVTRWYASQDAFDAVEYEIEPGFTITVDGEEYALIGLKQDGSVMLVNTDTATARPKVDLDALQILVAENEHNDGE